ncbi:GGDEF domain-containing protein [Actinoplanes sp. Pm04-4]|uniref:GGDEF domain-containing protein n=1 Tax=Paractinoplanes pyxinae TaxID=2997416 RepID=A0ABT4BC04_9ACTN|nr:GGDEF domain-containing protein [Actinoplanes pyxinae]MCY1144017.1 GGDEF domain-containing protein [Actinoplanes pyxinae]
MSPPFSSPTARRSVPIAAIAAVIAMVASFLAAGHPATRLSCAAAGGALAGYALAARHYLARARAEIAAAQRDPLTGLPTRAVAERLLADATAKATPVAVALADVDGLHAVNANFGHAAGDQYLVAVAQRLHRAAPDGGTLVRQGGDEFALIAPHMAADALATALGAALAGPAVIAGYHLQPRASIGVAAGVDARRTLARADAAMYSAKRAGGNAILTYDRDRDSEPAADGTRPALRRRDLIPDRTGAAGWAPPDDELMTLLISVDELRLLHDAVHRSNAANAAGPPAAGNDRVAPATAARALLAARLDHLLQAPRRTGPAHECPGSY